MNLAEPVPLGRPPQEKLSRAADVLMEGILSGEGDYFQASEYLRDVFGDDYTPQHFMDDLDRSYGYDQKIINELTWDLRDIIMAGGDVLRGNRREDEGFIDSWKRNITERQAAQNLWEMSTGMHGKIDPASLAASIPGGLGIAKLGLKGIQAGAKIAPQAMQTTLQSPLMQSAAIGGAEAGLRTATDRLPEAIDEPGRFFQHVLMYGGAGSMLGGAVPYLTGKLYKAAQYLKGMTSKGADERTKEVLFDVFQEYGDDAGKAVARKQELQQKFPETNVTVMDTSLAARDAAEAGAQSMGASRAQLVEMLEDRQAGQFDRLMRYLDENFAEDQNLITAAEQFAARASTEAGPKYKAIENIVVDDFKVLGFMKKKMFQDAYESAKKDQATRAANGLSYIEMPGGFQKVANDDGTFRTIFVEPEEYTIGMLDQVKQHMDDIIFVNKQAPKFGNQAAIAPGTLTALQKLRYAFVDAMDDALPDYKEARDVFSGNMEISEAFEMGSKFMNANRSVVATDWAGLKTKGAQQAYRIGARNAIQNRLGNLPETSNVAEKLRTHNAMDKFRIVFPENKFDEAAEYFMVESMGSKTKNAILANSATAKRQMFIERFGEDPSEQDIANFIYTGATNPIEAAKRAADLVRNGSPKVRDRVMKILLDDDEMLNLSINIPKVKKRREKVLGAMNFTAVSTLPMITQGLLQ